jgi:hypothetical protein
MCRIIDDASPIPHRASCRRVVTPSYSSAAQSVDDDLQEARGAHTARLAGSLRLMPPPSAIAVRAAAMIPARLFS